MPLPISPSTAVFLAGFAAAMNVGKLPSSIPALRDALGMSLVQAGLLVSAFQVAGMSLGMFGGLLADRFGPRRVMTIGLALLAGAGIAGAFVEGASALIALRALESVGFVLAVLPGPALMRRAVAPQRIDLMLGVWSAYMPAGMAFALLATPWLLGVGGWSVVWWFTALACTAAWWIVLGVVPRDGGHAQADRPGAIALARATISSQGPWLLALCFAAYVGQWMLVFSFLPTIYQGMGIGAVAAAALTAFGIAVNLVGNVASGSLIERGVPRATLLVAGSFAMMAGAWIAFGSSLSFASRYAGVLSLSAFGGLIPGTLFATAPRFAPNPAAVSTTIGLMQQGSSVGQFVTPPLAAAMASAESGWGRTWWLTCALACANVCIALLIGRLDRTACGAQMATESKRRTG